MIVRTHGLVSFTLTDVTENGISYVDIMPSTDTPLVIRLNCISLEELHAVIGEEIEKQKNLVR
jgi:hypothetical protein